jgi:predicted transcriptional regulator
MAQSNHVVSGPIELSDVLNAVDAVKEQLREDLTDIIQAISEESRAGLPDVDKFANRINETLNSEFGAISKFLEYIFQDALVARLESQLQKSEADRSKFAQEAADFRQKAEISQKKLLEVTNTMHSLAKRLKQLETIQKDYERTRYRLQRILESSNDEIVSQQVERMITLLIKAANRVKQAQQGQLPMEDEVYSIRKAYKAVKMLSEHDSTSRMILVLAEKGEIEIDHLAEITGQNRFLLKYKLKKWIRNGLIRTEENGRIIALAKLQV